MRKGKTRGVLKGGAIMRNMEELKEALCDDYCKYRDEALGKFKDPDDAQEWLIENYCEDCPLNTI